MIHLILLFDLKGFIESDLYEIREAGGHFRLVGQVNYAWPIPEINTDYKLLF